MCHVSLWPFWFNTITSLFILACLILPLDYLLYVLLWIRFCNVPQAGLKLRILPPPSGPGLTVMECPCWIMISIFLFYYFLPSPLRWRDFCVWKGRHNLANWCLNICQTESTLDSIHENVGNAVSMCVLKLPRPVRYPEVQKCQHRTL